MRFTKFAAYFVTSSDFSLGKTTFKIVHITQVTATIIVPKVYLISRSSSSKAASSILTEAGPTSFLKYKSYTKRTTCYNWIIICN